MAEENEASHLRGLAIWGPRGLWQRDRGVDARAHGACSETWAFWVVPGGVLALQAGARVLYDFGRTSSLLHGLGSVEGGAPVVPQEAGQQGSGQLPAEAPFTWACDTVFALVASEYFVIELVFRIRILL